MSSPMPDSPLVDTKALQTVSRVRERQNHDATHHTSSTLYYKYDGAPAPYSAPHNQGDYRVPLYIDSRWEGLSQLPRWHHNGPHKNHHTALVNRFDRLRARLELAHIPTASLLVAQTVHLHTLHQYINFITKNRQLRCATTG